MGKFRSVKEGDVFTNREGVSATYIKYSKPKHGIFNISGVNVEKRVSDVLIGAFKCRITPSICGVGYIGYGIYKTKASGVHLKAYACWVGMIKRCYSERDSHFKSYGGAGIYVEDSWLNYQNFASWYYKTLNSITLDYNPELDKDLKGGKVYSEDTCTLIPRGLNSLLRSLNYSRDIRNKHKLFDSRVGLLGKRFYIKGFNTELEAMYARKYIITSGVNTILNYLDHKQALPETGIRLDKTGLKGKFTSEQFQYLIGIEELVVHHITSNNKLINKWIKLNDNT